MKKLLLFTLVLMCSLSCALYGETSGQSALYGDSFMMRAQGAEALYWNPALITPEYHDLILPGLNQSFSITNNAFDIDTYNFINGSYLSNSDKEKILNHLDGKLLIRGESHSTLFGIAFSNIAFISGTHIASQARLSEKYMKLLLYGNEQDDYYFDRKSNNASAIAYQDFTLGIGSLKVNNLVKYDMLPDIYFGASGSILLGYGVLRTKEYSGNFHTGLDGMSLHQNVQLGTGIGGLGFKSMLGISSNPIPGLSVGMSMDNIFGNIHWFGKSEDRKYTMDADSVYIEDLEDDLVTQQDTVFDVSAFNTNLPPEFHMGALYDFGPASVSADWIQGSSDSSVTSAIGRLSVAGEYLPLPVLPLSLGVSFGNAEYPWRVSYGLGIRTHHFTAGMGFQSIKSVFPSIYSKGISFSSYVTVPY